MSKKGEIKPEEEEIEESVIENIPSLYNDLLNELSDHDAVNTMRDLAALSDHAAIQQYGLIRKWVAEQLGEGASSRDIDAAVKENFSAALVAMNMSGPDNSLLQNAILQAEMRSGTVGKGTSNSMDQERQRQYKEVVQTNRNPSLSSAEKAANWQRFHNPDEVEGAGHEGGTGRG